MAIPKCSLLREFFAAKFNVSGQRCFLPPTSSLWNGKIELIDLLPLQTSLFLTLTFLSEGGVYNLQNCPCSHT